MTAVWNMFVSNVDLLAFIGAATVVLTGLLIIAMACDWAARRVRRAFRRPAAPSGIPKAPPPMPPLTFNYSSTLPRRVNTQRTKADVDADIEHVITEAVRITRRAANH